MSATIDPVEADIYTALGAFIGTVLGLASGLVFQGIDNRVPTPPGASYVAMTITFVDRLATNVDTTDLTQVNPTVITLEKSTRVDVQLDCYGPAAFNNANILSTLLRDGYGCDALAPKLTPLYADDARELPLIDGEDQYQKRFMLSASFQYNPVVTVGQQFADAAAVDLINVDVTYPPT